MRFSALHITRRALVINPVYIRTNVTCAVLAFLNSGQQLVPHVLHHRLHVFPTYTKSSGDLFSVWKKEKRNRLI